jgi:hypothetical protein
VEDILGIMYMGHPVALFDEEVIAKIKDLEVQKNKFLSEKEKDWSIKSKSTFLASGN